MTDRELLTLAAKAAGIDLFVWGAEGRENFTIKNRDGTPGDRWNPLKDDGDCFRLACLREVDVSFRVVGGTRVETLAPGGPRMQEFYEGDRDRAAAARRAVVRAVAAGRIER
jgi:hypothetical protein